MEAAGLRPVVANARHIKATRNVRPGRRRRGRRVAVRLSSSSAPAVVELAEYLIRAQLADFTSPRQPGSQLTGAQDVEGDVPLHGEQSLVAGHQSFGFADMRQLDEHLIVRIGASGEPT